MRSVRAKESPPEIQILPGFVSFVLFPLFVSLFACFSSKLCANVTASLGMMPYPVMFYLQGRRGSGGQQGLAGTPGAAVRIETNKNQRQWNAINIQY